MSLFTNIVAHSSKSLSGDQVSKAIYEFSLNHSAYEGRLGGVSAILSSDRAGDCRSAVCHFYNHNIIVSVEVLVFYGIKGYMSYHCVTHYDGSAKDAIANMNFPNFHYNCDLCSHDEVTLDDLLTRR